MKAFKKRKKKNNKQKKKNKTLGVHNEERAR